MKVAFSKINITPKEYIGKSLAGYTRKEPCLGKLDYIHSYGVLIEGSSLDNKREYILLISVDLLKVPLSIGNFIKNRIIRKFPLLNPDNIIIHATHTHSSLDLTGEFFWQGDFFKVIKGIMFGMNRNDKYVVWVCIQIVKMVKTLFDNLEYCQIALNRGVINSDIVINRRHPERKTQTLLNIIVFRTDQTTQFKGIIINYACHPTTLSFKNSKLSADFPGRVVFRISELTNHKTSTIYFNGPCGDLNPITTCGINFELLSQDKSKIYSQVGDYNDTIRIGNKIAQEALKLAKSIPETEYVDEFYFKVFKRSFQIPMKDFKYFSKAWFINKLYFLIKKYFILKIAKINLKNANFPIFILKRKKLRLFCKSLVQIIKINALSRTKSISFSIMTIPGELFEDIGKNLIKISPTKKNTLIFQNSQDWIGYLFPLKEYTQEGGYEPIPSFSPLCGYYVEKEIKKLLDLIKIS